MIKIGITGGIGAGKSHVCNIIREMGYPVFDMDKRAAIIMNTSWVSDQIKEVFGDDIYKGALDRKRLAEIVFNDQSKLDMLNAIVHPAVIEHFNAWTLEQSSEAVFAESAIIFENNLQSMFDKVICVHATNSTRINRVMKRDGATEEMVTARMNRQWNQDKVADWSHFIIFNDDGNDVKGQLINTLETIKVANTF